MKTTKGVRNLFLGLGIEPDSRVFTYIPVKNKKIEVDRVRVRERG